MNDIPPAPPLDRFSSPAAAPDDPADAHSWACFRARLAPENGAVVDRFFAVSLFLRRLAARDTLSFDDRIAFLDHLDHAVADAAAGRPLVELPHGLHAPLADARIAAHAPALLQACRRELTTRAAGRPAFRDWSEMHNWLRFAAAPVGRLLIELHGEREVVVAPMEAMCIAIGLSGRLQDAGRQARDGGDCGLPRQWFSQAGADPRAFLDAGERPAARRALKVGGDRVRQLLAAARAVPERAADPRLRAAARAT
ncbi:MAG: squalene/phytoene synthase family protein, partial [Rhodospirillales bacterium]|nr:squalene/phytoene synthase family protein [Rhodospirillales bacterium]